MRGGWFFGLLGAALAAAFAATGCTPEIGSGTYYCGSERLCPPDLACDEATFTCVTPALVTGFTCPAGSESGEPNDDLGSATDVGELGCGDTVLGGFAGCISEAGDVDLFEFTHTTGCTGTDPHFDITLRYPIAFVQVRLELLDESGAVIATGENCTPEVDFSGQEALCIRRPPQPGVYYIRVESTHEVNCSGDCDYNRYVLDVQLPLA